MHVCVLIPQECPKCEPENRKIVDMKRSLEASAGLQEQFYKQVHARCVVLYTSAGGVT
jgi:ribosomal protein S10